MPILRGSAINFFASCMPGTGATVASMLAYATEKSLPHTWTIRTPGSSRGSPLPRAPTTQPQAAPSIPLLVLGVPGSGNGGHHDGRAPRPRDAAGAAAFGKTAPTWAIIASMYIGNVMLLILSSPS